MCYSRRRFVQCYPRWTRFHAKVFLTQALVFFGGAAGRCMVDNSTIIMTGGTGPDARAVPEMQEFSDRFGFRFVALDLQGFRSGSLNEALSEQQKQESL